APAAKPRTRSARMDQCALGLLRRRQVRAISPGCRDVAFVCGSTDILAPPDYGFFAGAGAAGAGGMSTTGIVGLNALSRKAIWPWRAASIDSPRMRAPSWGAWKPVEFSASAKSR